jgi:steroid delta-isomerase-like uncharacterized protein
MVMQVWKGELKPDVDKTALASAGERATPLFRDAKGFKKAFSAIDPTTHKMVFIEMWESEEDSRALGNNSEIQKEMANAQQFYITPLTLEGTYEVAFEM